MAMVRDLIVTNFSNTNTLYRSFRKRFFEDRLVSKLGPPSWLFLGWGVSSLI